MTVALPLPSYPLPAPPTVAFRTTDSDRAATPSRPPTDQQVRKRDLNQRGCIRLAPNSPHPHVFPPSRGRRKCEMTQDTASGQLVLLSGGKPQAHPGRAARRNHAWEPSAHVCLLHGWGRAGGGGISKDSQYVHGVCGGASAWISGSDERFRSAHWPQWLSLGRLQGDACAAFVCDGKQARVTARPHAVEPMSRQSGKSARIGEKKPLRVARERNTLKYVDKRRNK